MAESLEIRVDQLSLEDEEPNVSINYADGRNHDVPLINTLKEFVKDRDILLVGEGNFTFAVALAVFRNKSWEGITATRYEPISEIYPKPDISEVKLTAIKQKCLMAKETQKECYGIIKSIVDLPLPPRSCWQFGIDATNIPESLPVKGKTVWFQCPWIPSNFSATHELIHQFLKHMSSKQLQGDFTLIGITTLFPYVKNYRLHELLGDDLSGNDGTALSALRYKFLGADKTLIKTLLEFGYKHEGSTAKDIHSDLFDFHITLVFERI